jgi:hypothetical protein
LVLIVHSQPNGDIIQTNTLGVQFEGDCTDPAYNCDTFPCQVLQRKKYSNILFLFSFSEAHFLIQSEMFFVFCVLGLFSILWSCWWWSQHCVLPFHIWRVCGTRRQWHRDDEQTDPNGIIFISISHLQLIELHVSFARF